MTLREMEYATAVPTEDVNVVKIWLDEGSLLNDMKPNAYDAHAFVLVDLFKLMEDNLYSYYNGNDPLMVEYRALMEKIKQDPRHTK